MIKKTNYVRIIAGKYKQKKLPVLNLEGLRPTPDIVRETIFNWIGNKVQNAVILDLFAGSGVLGFEAISRGASKLYSVEKNTAAASNLKEQAQNFSEQICVFNQSAVDFLQNIKTQFDLIFLDPPYSSDLLQQCLPLLIDNQLIFDDSLLYVEMQAGNSTIVSGYQILQELTHGQVKYALWKKNTLW